MINGDASKGTITVSIKVTLKNSKTKIQNRNDVIRTRDLFVPKREVGKLRFIGEW